MAAAKIWKGFGTRVLANDIRENPSLEGVVEYVALEELLRESHLVSLHCPLLPSTFHLLNAERCAWTWLNCRSQRRSLLAAQRAYVIVTSVQRTIASRQRGPTRDRILVPLRCRIAMMKEGAFLINVSRGGLLDTEAAIDALERGQIGCLCVPLASWSRALMATAAILRGLAHTYSHKSAAPLQGHGRV